MKEKDVLIEQLLDQINQMKTSFHAWVERTGTDANPSGSEQMPPTVNGEDVNRSEIEEQTHVAKIPIESDESYFMTYAHFDIHYDMLSVSTVFGQSPNNTKYENFNSIFRILFVQTVIVKPF